MPVAIDWEGLTVAFENRSQKITHFFDRETGDVVQVLEQDAARHAELAGDPALPRRCPRTRASARAATWRTSRRTARTRPAGAI